MKVLASLLVLSSMVSAQSFEKVEYRYYLAGNTKTQRISGTLAFDRYRRHLHGEEGHVGSSSRCDQRGELSSCAPCSAGAVQDNKASAQFDDPVHREGTEKFANFELDSDTYHEVLAAAEAAFGKPVHRYPVVDPSP